MGKRVKDEDLPRHAEEAERGATLAAWAKAAVERQFGGNLSKAARATGVSRHTLWRLTVQRGTPDEGTITRLARAFGPPPGITLPDRDAAIAEAAELLEEAARLIDRARRRLSVGAEPARRYDLQASDELVGARPRRQAPHRAAPRSDDPKPKRASADS